MYLVRNKLTGTRPMCITVCVCVCVCVCVRIYECTYVYIRDIIIISNIIQRGETGGKETTGETYASMGG